jgi:hypothetical protein
MKINLSDLESQMYEQHLLRVEETFESYLIGRTIRGHFGWFNPLHCSGVLTLKVDAVMRKNGDIHVRSGEGDYFIYTDEDIEILD